MLLHGRADARTLHAAGFRYRVRVADLAAQARRNARRDAADARTAQSSGLPSGRTTYRRLPDYDLEMKNLALQYPTLVRPITLNHRSVLGRDVNGIEISTGAQNTADGKPIFLIMGVHHAREWPSAEHTIEFAYDLLRNYGRDARTTQLVQSTRTIVIPVVNPDGFNISREAAVLGDFSLFDYEMKRKNCRVSVNTPTKYAKGACDDNKAGRLRGTDPNRNYGGLWGGSGASTIWSDDTYRGDGPFSEPEVQNVRELISSRQVTNLITNHTFSNLVLRPPGVASFGFPLEEPIYKALGASLAAHNGYSNIPGFGLYDTTGATEDWSFWSTGGLAFTFEIGGIDFHPAFHDAVEAEYLGEEPATGAGKGGNREAYYTMLQATADSSLHSQIEGAAPAGSTLKISKTFQTSTSPVWQDDLGTSIGDPRLFTDTLTSEFKPAGGSFSWNVNPSTRPVVAGRHGRDADRPAAGSDHAAEPARRACREHDLPARRPHGGDPVHREGTGRRRGQRLDDCPHRVGEPGHRLGRLRDRPERRDRDAVGLVRRHHRGRCALRPAAGAVQGGRGQLRPGHEHARRLVRRQGDVPVARPADRDGREGGVDADLHRLARPAPGEPPGGRGPRRGGARGQRLPGREVTTA